MYTGPSIVITGFMCSGKSTVATAVARELGCPVVDLDLVVWSQTGRTPKQIIDDNGEANFRLAETKALTGVLNSHSQVVIALGGGAWIISTNRELIAKNRAVTFWLDAPFELCWSRIQADVDNRPLARNISDAHELFQSRLVHYALADHRIEVTDQTVAEIAAQIIRLLSDHK